MPPILIPIASLSIPIGLGILLFSLLKTREILLTPRQELSYRPSWKALFVLTGLILIGYLVALGFAFAGRGDYLVVSIGVVLLWESLCVYLATRVGLKTIRDLSQTSVSKAYVEKILRSLGDGLFVVDSNLSITFVNEMASELTGYPESELLGMKITCLMDPAKFDLAGLVGGRGDYTVEGVLKSKDERNVDVAISWSQIAEDGDSSPDYVFIIKDISERVKSEKALRESEERYALVVQAANDGVWDWDLKTDKIYFSSRWKSMLGFDESEIGDCPDDWFRLIPEQDLAHLNLCLRDHLAGKTSHIEVEHRIQHKEGGFRWVLTRGLAVQDKAGTTYRMAGSQTDITDRKLTEEALIQNASHDPLTGLVNRAFIIDRLEQIIAAAHRHPAETFGVLFLDLDYFKDVNDRFGHATGDQLLVMIARRLENCIRGQDILARLGGDEFIILIEHAESPEDIRQIAERIQVEMGEPFTLAAKKICVGVSIGIYSGQKGEINPEEVLRDADTAMYQAKARGRSRYEVYVSPSDNITTPSKRGGIKPFHEFRELTE